MKREKTRENARFWNTSFDTGRSNHYIFMQTANELGSSYAQAVCKDYIFMQTANELCSSYAQAVCKDYLIAGALEGI